LVKHLPVTKRKNPRAKKIHQIWEKEDTGLFLQNTDTRPSIEPGRRQVFMEKASIGNEMEESKIDESKF
jgi:hypothetical protein